MSFYPQAIEKKLKAIQTLLTKMEENNIKYEEINTLIDEAFIERLPSKAHDKGIVSKQISPNSSNDFITIKMSGSQFIEEETEEVDLDDEDRIKKLEQRKAEKKQLSAFKDRSSLVELFEKQKAIPLVRVFLTILILVLCISVTGGILILVITQGESVTSTQVQQFLISLKKKEVEIQMILENLNSLILYNKGNVTPSAAYFNGAIDMLNSSYQIFKGAHENSSNYFNQSEEINVLLYSEQYGIYKAVPMTLREGESMLLELLYRSLYLNFSSFTETNDVIKPLLYSVQDSLVNNVHNNIMQSSLRYDNDYVSSIVYLSGSYTLVNFLSIGAIFSIMVVVFFLTICLHKAKTKILNFFVKIPFKVLEEITKSCDDFLYTYQYQSNSKDDTDHATNASLLSSNKEEEEEEESSTPSVRSAGVKDPLQFNTKIKFGSRSLKAHCTTMLFNAFCYFGLALLLSVYFIYAYFEHQDTVNKCTKLIYFDLSLLNILRESSDLVIELQNSINDSLSKVSSTTLVSDYQYSKEKLTGDFQALEMV